MLKIIIKNFYLNFSILKNPFAPLNSDLNILFLFLFLPLFLFFLFGFSFNLFSFNLFSFIFTKNYLNIYVQDLFYTFTTIYSNITHHFSFLCAVICRNVTLDVLVEADYWPVDVILSMLSIYNTSCSNQNILNWLEDLEVLEFSWTVSFLKIFSINYSDLPFYQTNVLLTKPPTNVKNILFLPEYFERVIKNKIIIAFLITNFFSIYLKEKVIYFFLINFLLIFLMFVSITRLYSSINLIYALLHFLFFAVFSGLLIIFWGSLYLGFCVLLIYGAAIPVLALYIIMLVNVDLIQRLFFFEHINKIKVTNYKKKIIFIILLLLYILTCFKDINYFLVKLEHPALVQFYTNLNYFFIVKRHFLLLDHSFNNTNIYDLALSFYSSDLDKVASAAFKTSYNELFALVFLLLIAIIVVISISRTSTISNDVVTIMLQENLPKIIDTKHFDFYFYKTFKKLFLIKNMKTFFKKWSHFNIYGNWHNSVHDPLFIRIFLFGLLDIHHKCYVTQDLFYRLGLVSVGEKNPNDPWTDWFNVYSFDHLDNFIEQSVPNEKVLHLSEDEIDQEKMRMEEKMRKNPDKIKKKEVISIGTAKNEEDEEDEDIYTEEEIIMFNALHWLFF